MQKLELKIPPLAQMLIAAILMWGLTYFKSNALFHIPEKLWIAATFIVVGIVIAMLGVAAFRQVQTTVDPRIPDSTNHLVVNGIYKISRNPMYLGFLTILIGWAIYLSHLFAFLLLPTFILYMNRFQIHPEERFLLKKFGKKYQSYQSRVRRWI